MQECILLRYYLAGYSAKGRFWYLPGSFAVKALVDAIRPLQRYNGTFRAFSARCSQSL